MAYDRAKSTQLEHEVRYQLGCPGCGECGRSVNDATLISIADQLEAARAEIELKQGVIDSGNEAYRVAREQWSKELAAARAEIARLTRESDRHENVSKALASSHATLRAECEAMRPVVEATIALRNRCGALRDFIATGSEVDAAIDAYRAARHKAGG